MFDDLTPPQLAAVLASLVYESRRSDDGVRRPRMPDAGQRGGDDRRCAGSGGRCRWSSATPGSPRGPEPDIGFSRGRRTAGRPVGPLAAVLADTDLTAGDFVRWVRQVIDFAGQIADAAGPGALRETARRLVRAMRRGVVTYSPTTTSSGDT